MKENKSRKVNRISTLVVFLIVLSLCFAGCVAQREIDDSFGADFLPVMASTAESGTEGAEPTTANKPANTDKPNPEGKKRVAITYDDGPHVTRTKLLADELEKYGFHATFFVVGNRVDGTEYNGGQAMLYALEKGNEIAIHGYTHGAYYNKCSDEVYAFELSETVKAIQSMKPGYTPTLMRPIGGAITDSRVSSCEYAVIMWSVDSLDYKNAYVDGGVENIVNNVMSGLKDGDIILMHDIYENTYEASKIILKRLYDEGYEVVTVSELLGSKLTSGQKFLKR